MTPSPLRVVSHRRLEDESYSLVVAVPELVTMAGVLREALERASSASEALAAAPHDLEAEAEAAAASAAASAAYRELHSFPLEVTDDGYVVLAYAPLIGPLLDADGEPTSTLKPMTRPIYEEAMLTEAAALIRHHLAGLSPPAAGAKAAGEGREL